jgi:hypothetical protein
VVTAGGSDGRQLARPSVAQINERLQACAETARMLMSKFSVSMAQKQALAG